MDIEREGSGLLFDNSEYKDKNPNAPDFTGNVNVNGEQLRIAAWYKVFASGEGFSLSLTPIDGNYSGGREEEDEEPAPAPARRSTTAKPASRGTSKPSSGRTYSKPRR